MEDDEEELLAAAANWANAKATSDHVGEIDDESDQDSEPTDFVAFPSATTNPFAPVPNKTYSLHVTQLSYEATEYDVRTLFLTKGCIVTSVRLVYSHPGCQFRGVAFVDVQDEPSFQKALKLHRTYHLKRRINVRPTLVKEELGKIAEATKERIHTIITQQQQQQGQGQEDNGQADVPANNKTKKSKELAMKSESSKKSHSENSNKKDKVTPVKKSNKPRDHKTTKKKVTVKKAHSTDPRKLTKKERNRKAAILLQKKRRKIKSKTG